MRHDAFAPNEPGERFSLIVRPERHPPQASMAGELDVQCEADVLDRLMPAIKSRPTAWVLEIGELRFVDSSGLRLLLLVRDAVQPHSLTLAHPSPMLRRLLEITRLSDQFRLAGEDSGLVAGFTS